MQKQLDDPLQNENFDTYFIYTSFSMKWITGLNIEDKTIKCLWGYILGDLCDTDSDKRFLDKTSKAEFIKKK